MKNKGRQNRLGALSSLNQYRLKDCDGMTPRANKRNAPPRFGIPSSAYSTMPDIDDFFRKQKQLDLEWKEKKEFAFRKLHMYRLEYVHKLKGSNTHENNNDNNYQTILDDEHEKSTIDGSTSNHP